MRKKILLTIGLFIAAFIFVKAQNNIIKIYLPSNTDSAINGGHFTVQGPVNGNPIRQDLVFKQTSGSDMNMKAKSIVLNATSGSLSYFCDWNQCYSPEPCVKNATFKSPILLNAVSDSLYDSFYAEYVPDGNQGSTTIRYVFYEMGQIVGSTGDTSYVDVTYEPWPMGIKDVENENKISMFPNPASNSLQINFDSNTNQNKNIKIYDIVGNLVYSGSIKVNSKETIDVSNLNSGVYFVKFINGQKIIETKKLFIQK